MGLPSSNKFKALFTPQETACNKPQNGGRHAFNQRRTGKIGSMTGQLLRPIPKRLSSPAEKVDALDTNQNQLCGNPDRQTRAEEKQNAKRLRRSMAISSRTPVRRGSGRDVRRWAKLRRWEPTMLSSTKKPAHLPQTNTSRQGAGIMPRYRRVNIDGQSLYKTETPTTAAALLPVLRQPSTHPINSLRPPR